MVSVKPIYGFFVPVSKKFYPAQRFSVWVLIGMLFTHSSAGAQSCAHTLATSTPTVVPIKKIGPIFIDKRPSILFVCLRGAASDSAKQLFAEWLKDQGIAPDSFLIDSLGYTSGAALLSKRASEADFVILIQKIPLPENETGNWIKIDQGSDQKASGTNKEEIRFPIFWTLLKYTLLQYQSHLTQYASDVLIPQIEEAIDSAWKTH